MQPLVKGDALHLWDPLGAFCAEGPSEQGAPAAKQYSLAGSTLAQRFPVRHLVHVFLCLCSLCAVCVLVCLCAPLCAVVHPCNHAPLHTTRHDNCNAPTGPAGSLALEARCRQPQCRHAAPSRPPNKRATVIDYGMLTWACRPHITRCILPHACMSVMATARPGHDGPAVASHGRRSRPRPVHALCPAPAHAACAACGRPGHHRPAPDLPDPARRAAGCHRPTRVEGAGGAGSAWQVCLSVVIFYSVHGCVWSTHHRLVNASPLDEYITA